MTKDILTLHKYLVPLLSRYPEEAALIPAENGWFSISLVVRALHENSLFKWVRANHLVQLPHLVKVPLVEVYENHIRPTDISAISFPVPVMDVPEILYTYCKPKSLHHIYQKGLLSLNLPFLLSVDKQRILEIGKRFFPDPVLLQIQTFQTSETQFQQFGSFFLANIISPQSIIGPSVESLRLPKKAPAKSKEKSFSMPTSSGSFFIEETKLIDKNKIRYVQKKGQKKEIDWKKERRKGHFDK